MYKKAICPRCKSKTLLLVYPAQVNYKLTELVRHINDIAFRYDGEPWHELMGDPSVKCTQCEGKWATIVDCYAEIVKDKR